MPHPAPPRGHPVLPPAVCAARALLWWRREGYRRAAACAHQRLCATGMCVTAPSVAALATSRPPSACPHSRRRRSGACVADSAVRAAAAEKHTRLQHAPRACVIGLGTERSCACLRFADVVTRLSSQKMMPSTGGKSERSVTDQLTPAGLKKSRLTAGGTHETHESVNQEDSVMSDGEPKGASASASSASSSDGDGGGSPSAAEPEGDGSAAVDVPEGEPDAWADPDSWVS